MKTIGTPERIIELTAESFGINYEDIVGRSRKREIVLPRHISIYLISQYFKAFNQVKLASFFNRERTTIIHSLKEYEDCIDRQEINLFDITSIIGEFEDEKDEYIQSCVNKVA